jgi:inhibitor of cysteine peptidase
MVDLVLTEADAGRTVQVAPDTVVHLRLPENPSTGYHWTVTIAPAECLRVGADRFERASDSTVGAGGIRVIEIAVAVPHCALTLAYRRPWDSETSAASELVYRFVTAP